MTESEAALRERLAMLSRASLRINESLDFDTVLQGALDSARALTGARYGVMTLLEGAGRVGDFLASGMTAEEAEQLWQTPERWAIFERLGGLSEPLRIPDLVGYVRSLGFAEFSLPLPAEPASPFLASQMLHGSGRVGNIFLAGREDGREFSPEDEQTLVMFAAQAALVIANARTHREERRARADLETLIDTSPVGVVVFDALTGAPKSFNREARRIADMLRDPEQSPEMLLDVITCVRADGREFSLREFPLAELLSASERVRAEEIVLRVPDGRSVTALLNATPIRSDEGAVESVVVTLQDMADVEELERLRAEFLAMVSHELRAPLAAVKGSTATLLESAGELDPAVGRQFFRLIEEQVDHMYGLVSDLLDVARIETGSLAVSPEPVEAATLVERARSAFKSAGGRNNLAIDVEPNLSLVMADRRRIVQVLGNLLTNAARHSSESSVIRGERRARRGACGRLGGRRGTGHPGGEPAIPVPQVLAGAVRGAGRGHGPGPCHLQGDRGGPRGAHLGRERRAGPRRPLHLHPARGRRRRERYEEWIIIGPDAHLKARAGRDGRNAAHSGGG